MEYINVGKIITTHGLNGELKIRSDFKYKDLIFKCGFTLYIGKLYEKHIILSYRKHKCYDMVLLDNISDIDKAIHYKQSDVYILKTDLVLDNKYLKEDLIGLNVLYNDNNIGVVLDIIDVSMGNELLKLEKFYIPNNSHFVKEIDLNKKIIIVYNIEGLIL